ncbi:nitrate- and nitrite sensing domain-containing protein [Streptomyces sp. TRM64462]|uniref:sensor histidine kinase n=1 Tax=Streptomyces sp. TRM64462 TaxID=2741726 RepID=UPI001586D5F6|nr:nitrate- and nitrite sensing domain-containing protein [Streptomyces sp. TRM64462]
MRFRGKSIRRKIVALLLVPLISLTGLWSFATYLTGREAGHLMDVGYIVEKVGYPLEDTVRVIQQERRQTLVYLADPRTADALTTLRRDRATTDRTLAVIRANARDSRVTGAMHEPAAERLASLVEALDGLETLRRSVDTRAVGRLQALEFYNRLVDPCYTFLVHLHALDNVEMDKQGRALVGLARAREMLAREDALIVSSLISNRLTAQEVRLLSDLVARREQFYQLSLEVLPAEEREVFQRYWHDAATQPLRQAEEAVISGGATGSPRGVIDAVRWEQAAAPVLSGLATQNTEAGDRYQERVEPVAYGVLVKAGIAGVLGFLALVVSVVVSVRIGRSLVRDLSRLRKEAQEVSGVRLPSVMRRLAAGEHVDVETEVPQLEYDKDEVGQVGKALNTLQRAAVEAAVKQADMRRGVSEVFVNLARRNQVLLHRQLTLLDAMERRTEDTEELADLFRLDHLTTRMRRHAEGLVILSGAAPSRQWRKPVQLMDVVRAAVAEVEDYERIEVRRLPRIGVGGPAVADLTHLIAELLENATVFSPPHTAVQVHGERVANGFTLEIHDRGLGMSAEDLLDANLRLAETPEFELSDTDRLGLFVVSRLARRQSVRVSLQPSPYGGTTAVVFIPAALLTDAPATEGAGFRLDRAATTGRGNGTERKKAVEAAVLDGPVELEGPIGPIGPLGILGDLDAHLDGDLTDSLTEGLTDDLGGGERNGLFRPRPRTPLRPATGPGPVPGHEQHHQAPDTSPGSGHGNSHLAPAVPLPRRKPQTPTLIARHGRRVDTPEPDPAPATPDASDQNTLTLHGLPRRVRQASLVPQLRESAERPGPATADRPCAEEGTADRDAEEVRSRMAAMQRGWQRARRQHTEATTQPGPDTDGAAADPSSPGFTSNPSFTSDTSDTTAPGTTPEGNGR